jgi:hypothetical protein
MSQKKKNIDEAKAAMARATNSQTSGTTTGGLQTGQVIQVNQPEHVCPYCGRCKHCGQPVPPPIYPHPVIIPAPTVPPYQPFPFPFPYIGDPIMPPYTVTCGSTGNEASRGTATSGAVLPRGISGEFNVVR